MSNEEIYSKILASLIMADVAIIDSEYRFLTHSRITGEDKAGNRVNIYHRFATSEFTASHGETNELETTEYTQAINWLVGKALGVE